MADETFPKGSTAGAKELIAHNARVVNAEVLSEGQRRCVDRYIELSRSSGVIVGAHVGPAAWDMRPLLLEEGKMFMLRFSDPELALQKERLAWLERSLQRQLGLGARSGLIGSGAQGGQIWVKRRYHRRVLADDLAVLPAPRQRVVMLERILAELRVLHRNGLVHGHVFAANVVTDDPISMLLDLGFFVASRSSGPNRYAAPELGAAFPPAASADIFGFGALVQQLQLPDLPPSIQKLLQGMSASEPAQRPALEEIEAAVSRLGSVYAESAPVSGVRVQGSPPTGVGKVITGNPNAAKPGIAVASHQTRELKKTVLVPREFVDQARKDVSAAVPPASAQVSPPAKSPDVPPPAPVPQTPAAAPTPPIPAAMPPGSAPQIQSRQSVFLWIVLVIMIAVALVRFTRLTAYFTGRPHESPAGNLEDQWLSGRRSLMAPVAEAATSGGDQAAQRVIITEALHGKNNLPLVRARLLQWIFDARWEHALTPADKDAALRLAVAPLYPQAVDDLPPIDQLNPMIAVGVAGDLSLSAEVGPIGEIPLAALQSLPAPVNDVFERLAGTGAKTLGDPDARALAHLALGDASDAVLERFFSGDDPHARLALVMPLCIENNTVAAKIAKFLERGQSLIADYFKWFESEEVAQWNEAPAYAKLSIVAGVVPGNLSLEQYADLLQFPDTLIRQAVAVTLVKNYLGVDAAGSLRFLASDSNQLGRFQTVALVTGFKLDPDPFYAFLQKWFQGKPDPGTVLGLLLARTKFSGVDTYDVEAARYLTKVHWDASLNDLSALAKHPEPLARALAYSKLDENVPNEREILADAFKREPNQKFRDELARRLAQQK